MSSAIRILVAEDHMVARVGVSTIVNMQPDMTVVAEASNGNQAGEMYLPAAVAASLAAQLPRPDLSAREVQVLQLIVRGLANKQIAYALSIAEHTVKNHVKNILSKLAVQDRTQAATVAIQRGIIHL